MRVRDVVASVVVSSAVFAAEPSESAAKALFARGNQQAAAGDYAAALESFRSAYARLASPKILLNIGTMQKALGHFADAALTYERYLTDAQADITRRAEVEAALQEAISHTGDVEIRASVRDARVLVDDREIGRSPAVLRVRLDEGAHVIVADDGKTPVAVRLTLPGGEHRAIQLSRDDVRSPHTLPIAAQTTGMHTQTLAYVLTGAGVIGVAIGTYFVADRAHAVNEQTGSPCNGGRTLAGCDATAAASFNASGDTIDRDNTRALLGFAVGGAALVTGIALLAMTTASADRGAVAAISPTPSGAVVRW